ncbi:MAG TPA: hypothetical protein VF362_00455 [Demequinaceae bacterium]
MFKRKQPPPSSPLRLDPAIISLRRSALSGSIDDLGQRRDPMPPVWLAVMEWVVGDSAVTLVSVNDGSTSLYFSHGGGFIGAGTHEPVAIATGQFLGECYLARAQFAPAMGFDFPPVGVVRFYCRTDEETLTASAPEDEVRERDHPLFRPWAAAQAVISQIRQHSPSPGAGAPPA